MSGKINIMLVLRTGGDFQMSDVILLAYNLHKNITKPVNIYCLYDGIDSKLTVFNVIFIPMQFAYKGWWSKLNLFSPTLEYLKPFTYFDLDTAIVDNISRVIEAAQNLNKFIALADLYHKDKLASGIMHFPKYNKQTSNVWSDWVKNSIIRMEHFRGDGEYIRTIIKGYITWQSITNIITSFKPKKRWLRELPEDKSIVCFHGKPRIHEAAKTVKWVNKYIRYE